jgi:hypothetical protein
MDFVCPNGEEDHHRYHDHPQRGTNPYDDSSGFIRFFFTSLT